MMRLRMEWENVMRNIPGLSVYPDYNAPIMQQVGGRRVIKLARWGLLSLKDPVTEKVNKGTTNIRHPFYYDWNGYLAVENRRLALSTASQSRPSCRTEPPVTLGSLWTPQCH
ncbi:hypothetical protein [Devosia sp.]|uniref:hypothetical protein n=1 Tax=Devosia sp. TaxID=1871048 RepID=UPI002617B23E|nr:hypothetical protein [Devosia sp.]